MTTFVALLRGINVGRAKRIAMADLRALVERLGFSDVRTLLNSGNVVFRGEKRADTAERIERAIEQDLGVRSRVTVLTAEELRAIAGENPLVERATDPSRHLVAVFRTLEERTRNAEVLEKLGAKRGPSDVFEVGTRAAYLWCPDGILASPLAEVLGRALGDSVTTRNWATIEKLLALAEAPEQANGRQK